MLEQILQLIEMGGPVVVILGLLSIISLTVFLFKVWQFLWMGIGRHNTAQMAVTLWVKGEEKQALSLVQSNGRRRSVATKLVCQALQGMLFHPDKNELVREDLDRIAGQQLTKARQKIRLLEITGQVAPLLGLFGTVIGMIEAFQAMQKAGASIDPSVLAGGIWVALLTTAVGLAVAIPSSLFANWFESRLEREEHAIEMFVTSILTKHVTNQPGQTSSQSKVTNMSDKVAAHAHS